MQLRKFYGRTLRGTLAQVKRELGAEALIVETRAVEPRSAAARMNPGAQFEVCAVREARATRAVVGGGTEGKIDYDYDYEHEHEHEHEKAGKPLVAGVGSRSLLEDLGSLRAQIRRLLDGEPAPDSAAEAVGAARLDLRDYHELIESGVAPEVLAPHFRRWLQWRTATPIQRNYLARLPDSFAARMESQSLREWLWRAWTAGLPTDESDPQIDSFNVASSEGASLHGSDQHASARSPLPPASAGGLPHSPLPEHALARFSDRLQPSAGPRVVALVGPTGAGKTTTLAKMASINRHTKRQNAVILTLDSFRYGATQQWRQVARLMGVAVEEIVSLENLTQSMERWDRYDWVGIDTPGGMSLDGKAGSLYGHILAHCPLLHTTLVLPVTHDEAVNRDQLDRSRHLGVKQLLFTKLDETPRHGTIVNLTLDRPAMLAGLATGPRVPDDWTPATPRALWDWVLAPRPGTPPAGGAIQ